MITKANYDEMKAKRLETIQSPGFITKPMVWRAIRSHCLECVGSTSEVSRCDGDDYVGRCPLHPYRFGHKDVSVDAPTSKPKLKAAIREMCVQCMSGNARCESQVCNLRAIRWPS